MYGRPANFDASIFLDASVEQICFSRNTITIYFDLGYLVTLEGAYEHRSAANPGSVERAAVPVLQSRLIELVGKAVMSAEIDAAGTFVLRFDDGQVLRCIDDSDKFESYRISCGDAEIII
jgi:hypothetical protein